MIERSNKLLGHVSVIHNALQEIFTLTCSSQSEGNSSTVHCLSTPGVKGKPVSMLTSHTPTGTTSAVLEQKSGSLSAKATPQRNPSRMLSAANRHTSTHTMLNLATPAHTFAQLAVDQVGGGVGEKVLNHFCTLVNETVVKAVLQSHGKFIKCLGSTPSGVDHKEVISHTAMTRSCPDIDAYSSQDTPVLFKPRFTCSVKERDGKIAPSSQAPFSDDSLSTPLLQLMVDVHFTTPRIQLVPSLDKVHSDLLEISEALLRVLHHVKWWASPNADRTIYDLFEISAMEEASYDAIRRSIQGEN